MAENNQKNQDADDVVFEAELDSDNAKDPAEMIKALKEKLKVSQKERQEYLEGWQRTKADYANARKDEEKSRAEFTKFSKEGVIRDILPALDSFHIAFGNKEAWEKVDLNWRMGVQYIYSQLIGALENNGITLIEPKVGEPFDTQRHESIATVPTDKESENHTVADVVQKGYSLHGKIVQPAKVKLAEYTA
ncbi:MAG: nucleotide exchange factor GrpE [Candidatus Taylorbacteria bacterium]|nr:nucleotide exchange factor GrpE [Candidatus Taylorbacteria bacterium]